MSSLNEILTGKKKKKSRINQDKMDLRKLDIARIDNKFFKDYLFEDKLKNVEILDLSNNQIVSIENEAFKLLPKLRGHFYPIIF